MRNRETLREQLERPHVPEDLEHRIRLNWHSQQYKSERSVPRHFLAAGMLGILIGVALIQYFTVTPDLLSVAFEDVKKEQVHKPGISLPFKGFVKRIGLHSFPESMPIYSAKFCNLGGDRAMHISVSATPDGDAAQDAKVHLFIKEGEFSVPLIGGQGEVSMPWKLIRPRNGLTVLVMYDETISSDAVDALLGTMFHA
ncbi:MAG: DUF3379 domain-containing protein [Gammaproteobacteria bacterium]|nr:DUF3379 domain-containing protein [Gammaproteobacteria bacterium]MDH5799835.1 DUF3379 domain-containing protein [Gammaproteobacteria bacterium]